MSSDKLNKSLNTLNAAEIGDRLRLEREKRGLKQAAVAYALGVGTAAAVSNYENGHIPTAQILVRYAALFETSVDWILTGAAHGEIKFQIAEAPMAWNKKLDRNDRAILDEVADFLNEASDRTKTHLRTQVELLLNADRFKKVKKK